MTLTPKCQAACRFLVFLLGFPLCAQVSPGPLSHPHQSLDGPLKCASCHIFGAGAPKLRCLHCHGEIRLLVARKRGYHGRVVNRAKGDIDCARCHTEHYGENFNIIRWPTSKDEFDHRETGYPLLGRHAGLRCEQCHNPRHISAEDRKRINVRDLTRTFQGLSAACLTCHEDPHTGQLGADCQRCHNFTHWKPATTFDHSTAHYPLTGRHQEVPCAKCHHPLATDTRVTQYTGLKFAECNDCHQDPHHGAFAARCESCHNTGAWKQVRSSPGSFDHDKTKFPLAGKHVAVACLKCHKDANFKTPVPHALCMDCHRDVHKGQFQHRTGHGECAPCHNEAGFRPSTFSVANHQSTEFPLAGKHAGVACAKCHTPAGADTNYHPAFKACTDCHKDPHRGQFAAAPLNNRCEQCHTVDTFRPSTFTLARHQNVRFPLRGAHEAVACLDCHRAVAGGQGDAERQFHFPDLTCQGCHQDPHRGEFPATLKSGLKPGQNVCESCHGLRSWRELKPFDHATTKFALTGAHRVLACLDCHRPGEGQAPARQLHFQGAPGQCVGCHEDVHAGQFQRGGKPADCSTCHSTTRWVASLFDHNKGTNFALTGAHEKVPCKLCHFQRRPINGRSVVIFIGTPSRCQDCHRR